MLFRSTHPSTLNDVAILRTLNNLILKDQNSIAYKSTLSRMLSNKSLSSNLNTAFSQTECRPPTLPPKSLTYYIDKVIHTLHSNNLDMFDNSALHLTLREMVSKAGEPSILHNALLDHNTQLFPNHQPISRQQFINKHNPSVPLELLKEAHRLITLKSHNLANTILKTSNPYNMIPVEFNPTHFVVLSDGTIPIWTNGSCKRVHGKSRTGWGVYFRDNSVHNTAGSSSLSINNFHAELEAIEYALSIAPTSLGITLFKIGRASCRERV